MPYITKTARTELASCAFGPRNAGELNYVISQTIKAYWLEHQKYQAIAEITGALENAKQEFYRRIAIPYEDAKIKENGDVY